MTVSSSYTARVGGQYWSALPEDLYVPPDALEVVLEIFEGPLDLLLYLIRKQDLDILNIPVAEVTRQYVEYIQWIQTLKLELAAEYLEMAAFLTEIKSRLLLPRPVSESLQEEADPRKELVRRLQAYEACRQAASLLDDLPRLERDWGLPQVALPEIEVRRVLPPVRLEELVRAFQAVLRRAALYQRHYVRGELLSVRERMSALLSLLAETSEGNALPLELTQVLKRSEGRLGLVVSFLALLELVREGLIELIQTEPAIFSPIHFKRAVYLGASNESWSSRPHSMEKGAR